MRICALWRLRQADHKLEASLGNAANPCLNMKQNHEYSIMKRKTKSQSEFNLHPLKVLKGLPRLTNVNLLNSCLDSYIRSCHRLHEGVQVTGNDPDNQEELAVTGQLKLRHLQLVRNKASY